MSSPSESKSARRRLGPFTLGRKLGTGGMGVVYQAVYDQDSQDYAVKVLSPGIVQNPQVVARFEREMAILKRMRHPHIVRYFGGGKSGGRRFFAMEYMPGGSVEELIKKKGKIPWEDALEILIQLAKALEFAHGKGVIHRDLKPGNLFICKDGTVKLGDFGIARDTDATALTAAGRTVGTYAYMAPEQIAGKPPISPKTDLYALGCVGFEMLTGRPPYVTDTPAEMLFGHLNEEPPRVREYSISCPLWLDEVIDRLLAKDPEDRYYDALAVQVALEDVKKKVNEQESYVRQTIQGGATAMGTFEERELQRLVRGKKKKKKKKKSAPIYERAWFLLICLVLVIGGVTWAAWPPSEQELYANASTLMESDDPTDWQKAHEEYLKPLVTRFPESAHMPQVKEWIQQAEVSLLERQIENLVTSESRKPRNETERLLVEAWRLEKEEPLVAAAKYQGLIKLKRGVPEDRLYVVLAERRLRPLVTGMGTGNEAKAATIDKALKEARAFYIAGEIGKAKGRWESIVALYGDDRELALRVQVATDRLAGKPPSVSLKGVGGGDGNDDDGAP